MGMETADFSVEVNNDSLRTVKVNSLKEIPVLDGALIVDLDGFLCCRGKENERGSNLLRLKEFSRVISESERLLISTGRVSLDNELFAPISNIFEKRRKLKHLAVSYCPVLTKESKVNLESFFYKVNSNCRVDFDVDWKKYLTCNGKTLNFGETALIDGLSLTVLGSGLFDQRVAKKIGEKNGSFDRISFYSLGWGLI
jgi:hypothetical protein